MNRFCSFFGALFLTTGAASCSPCASGTFSLTGASSCVPIAAVVVPILGAILLLAIYIMWRCKIRLFKNRVYLVSDDPKIPSAPSLDSIPNLQVTSRPNTSIKAAPYDAIAAATGRFDVNRVIGRGGFGPVYRGTLAGRAVAVKALDRFSSQGIREFMREVDVLRRYVHCNILPLLVSCQAPQNSNGPKALLVYPLMATSLDKALASSNNPLSAASRLRIAAGIASGLQYLHAPGQGLEPIIHSDIKSSNILLDQEQRARIGDFGLARRAQTGDTTITQGVGTHGYMDPEYIDMGTFSPKSDIFSMGVVFLELLTGQAATNSTLRPVCLYARMRSRLPADARSVAASEARWANPPSRVVEEFAQIAVRCVAAAGEDRPTLLEVLRYKRRNAD